MSEPMPEVVLLRPRALAEAVAMRSDNAGSRILAGGTDLVVNMRRGLVPPGVLIDISAIDEIRAVTATAGGLRIGAGVTLARIAADQTVRESYTALSEAASTVAGPGHRTSATLGGNLCLDTRCLYYNQSHWWRKANAFCLKYKGETCHVAPQAKRCRAAFSGDLAPALIVHDAVAEIVGPRGTRSLPLADLYQDDGAQHLTLGADEILAGVTLRAEGWRSTYAKVRVRDSVDFPLAGVAAAVKPQGKNSARLRLAITGTDSRPLPIDGIDEPWPLPLAEVALDRLDKLVQKQVSPMRTTATAAHYRRLAAAALAKRLVVRLTGGAQQ